MKIILMLLCFVAFSSKIFPQPNNPTKDSTNSFIEALVREYKIPTLGLGIIQNGQLQQIQIYGNYANKETAPYNTVFNVASLTKPITALLTLKLVENGLWSLDEPIANYWVEPGIGKDLQYKKLTTRLILSHQTGLPNWIGKNPHFDFAPGEGYQYSGEAFELLRNALEKKFNMSLHILADRMIFGPLKMQQSTLVWNKKMDKAFFSRNYDTAWAEYNLPKNGKPNAADDLLTTVQDYGVFLTAVLNNKIINQKMFSQLATPQIATKNGKHFGLGLEIYTLNDGNVALSHSGSDKGVQTIFFLLPQSKNGILIFTNVDEGYKIFEPLLLHYWGELGKQIIDIEMGKN